MKDIIGYEGKYAITEDGRVWSYKNNKFLAQTLNKVTGYYSVNLWMNNIVKVVTIHRLVALAYIPTIEGKLFVNHKNGIKTDNTISNLEWCTKSENAQHALDTGLVTYTCRLTNEEFITVLWDVINGESYTSVCMRVPYKVPFLSTKLRKIANELNIIHLLDASLREQKINRARRNLESINHY